jgi:ubiquinone/menaquinone biosynthesis C-methylase UbiE
MLSATMSLDSVPDAVAAQRAYYAATASRYDDMHLHEGDEHYFSLCLMVSFLEFLNIESVLDIGTGTGRSLVEIKRRAPAVRVVGVEPSPELREIGCGKGLSPTELVDGDGQSLAYRDGEFDLVCEFGALHHMPDPDKAVAEMLRVARKAIFISDANNFGQGTAPVRAVKQLINSLGLWPLANFVKTKGKGYRFSGGDGVAYSYSVFNQYPAIKAVCKSVHMINTRNSGPNLYRSASHVALLGIK